VALTFFMHCWAQLAVEGSTVHNIVYACSKLRLLTTMKMEVKPVVSLL